MNILEHLVRATTRHPLITILIVLGITALALVSALNFAIDTNIEEMFESDDPDIKMVEDVRNRFGEQEVVTVVIDCSSSSASNAQSYIEKLAEKLRKDGRFKGIQYKQDFSGLFLYGGYHFNTYSYSSFFLF